ncbi:PIN domain-containing protein [Thermosulfurimonas sp. F29]|nr:PIN domain-containing protein [Thermosulfurimonas sp. F29]
MLAYEYERKDLRKRAIAGELLGKWRSSGKLVISVQVLQELYVVLTRKMGIPEERAEEVVRLYAQFPVVNADPDLVLRGIEISRKYRISLWDALIVSAALRAGCRTIFTEDLSHGMKIEGIEIVNPFFLEET